MIAGTAKALASPQRLENTVAKEKAAIEGILDQQDVALSIANDLVEELSAKFAPVLSQDDLISPDNPIEQPYYGSSQVFRRIQDQYLRANNIQDKLRVLRRVAEV